MDILPISHISDDDAPLIDPELINLAKLYRLKLNVPKGIVVLPPDFALKTILKHYDSGPQEVFEQSLSIIKREIRQIPIPEGLDKAINPNKVKVQTLWHNLLELWLQEIRSRVWRLGLTQGLTLNLSAQSIFFIDQVRSSGTAYFDPVEREVVIHIKQGELSKTQETLLEEQTTKINKLLFLPQIVHWVIDSKKHLYIVKLSPYTSSENLPSSTSSASTQQPSSFKPLKSGVKVYLDLSSGLTIEPEADGLLICAEKAGHSQAAYDTFDLLVLKLTESARSYFDKPVIFKLSDRAETSGGVRGAQALLHSGDLLKTELEAFLFARQDKKLTNLELAVPFTRSVHELKALKQALDKISSQRLGTTKLWLEAAVPENIIQIEDYILTPLSGIILNLDELSSWLGGYDLKISESIAYSAQVSSLLQFVDQALSKLNQEKIPVIASGALALNPEVLTCLIKHGVFGLAVSLPNSYFLRSHLQSIEKKLLRDKLV